MWYSNKDIKKLKPIIINDLRGYVLPHAGTKHTSHILSHTLRYRPDKETCDKIKYIYIFYYPANKQPNVDNTFHEYYTVQKSFNYAWKNYWNIDNNPQYIPVNLRDNPPPKKIDLKSSIIIISADFSHHLNLQKAIKLENCAAHSILHRYLNLSCSSVIDHQLQFQTLYNLIPKKWILQWVGRTRSSGIKGVGYLSFIIRDNNNIPNPDGIFVTAYDKNMRQRECLGQWYNREFKFSNKKLNKKIKEVVEKARTTSRLTGGNFLNVPLHSYSITFLYKDDSKEFIRGWHGIKHGAFYLPDVFLENTFDNGEWIKPASAVWPQEYRFNIRETLDKLNIKGNRINLHTDYTFYTSRVVYKNIKSTLYTKHINSMIKKSKHNLTIKNEYLR
tara:strand:+ start:161 stop:1324 length:1164 start_codon:yes stop_codon:yes gene_type:complete